jgi:hypothetical protein
MEAIVSRWEHRVRRRREASRCVARTRMCPECVRAFYKQTTLKVPFAGTFGKPSDGLEPSTPPYHGGFGATRAYTRDH